MLSYLFGGDSLLQNIAADTDRISHPGGIAADPLCRRGLEMVHYPDADDALAAARVGAEPPTT